MRPIERGEVPLDANGKPKAYPKYQDAKPDLEERLGRYCSFCERFIASALAVEHIQPKKHFPELETTWGNFLLACTNCNSHKGDTQLALDTLLLPDRHNTFYALRYQKGGRVKVNPNLSDAEKARAENLITLVGLDKIATDTDKRWIDRYEAWGKAKRAYNRLFTNPSLEMMESIVEQVVDSGHFSIWMTVFAEDAFMQQRMLNVYRGTAKDCILDSNYASRVERS